MRKILLISFVLAACNEQPPIPATQLESDTLVTRRVATSDTPARKSKMNVPATSSLHDRPVIVSQELSKHIPQGFTVLDTAFGDLNLDAYPDALLALRRPKEDSLMSARAKTVFRPLIILLGKKNGGYVLSARCDKAIYCIQCGGGMEDPFVHMAIDRGVFTINNYRPGGHRWGRDITFRYRASTKRWILQKDVVYFYTDDDSSDLNKTKDFLENKEEFGKKRFENYTIYKPE